MENSKVNTLIQLIVFCTLTFFTSKMIFAGKPQSEHTVTPRRSFIALRGGYSSVLSRLLQKTVHLENKTQALSLTNSLTVFLIILYLLAEVCEVRLTQNVVSCFAVARLYITLYSHARHTTVRFVKSRLPPVTQCTYFTDHTVNCHLPCVAYGRP